LSSAPAAAGPWTRSLKEGYSRFPAPGDGQLDVTSYLSIGGSPGKISQFFFVEVGYRRRTPRYAGNGNIDASGLPVKFSDGIAYYAQIGYDFFDHGSAENSIEAYRTNGLAGVDSSRFLTCDWTLNIAPRSN
jgi:hypothetical protein